MQQRKQADILRQSAFQRDFLCVDRGKHLNDLLRLGLRHGTITKRELRLLILRVVEHCVLPIAQGDQIAAALRDPRRRVSKERKRNAQLLRLRYKFRDWVRLEPTFVIEEDDKVRQRGLCLRPRCQFLVKIFKKLALPLPAACDIPDAQRIVIGMGKIAQPLHLRRMAALCDEKQLQIRIILPGGQVKDKISQQPEPAVHL